MSTTRLTPSASGLAQAGFCGGETGALAAIAAVVSTSSGAGLVEALGVATASRSASGARMLSGAAANSTRAEAIQNQMAMIATADTTLANIRPNALRMVYCSSKALNRFSLNH
jgi:hypothetical protein